MLFSGDEALKQVKVLSGGEKVRCVLSKMMLSGANLLIFDEPTNHLDMESITALNEGMKKFTGNILFTSHDHELTQTVANRIIDIKEDGYKINENIIRNIWKVRIFHNEDNNESVESYIKGKNKEYYIDCTTAEIIGGEEITE